MKRSLDVAAIVATALLLLAFAALSVRGLIAPEQASARFGAPIADAAGSLFYRVYPVSYTHLTLPTNREV